MSTSRILDEFLDQPPMRERIVAVRTADQSLLTNVPHLVVHHSPLGYEWGYGGSGPSDFALNIAENMLRLMDHEGPLMEGRTFDRYRLFRAAWELHQPLKAPTPTAETTIKCTTCYMCACWYSFKISTAICCC